MSRDPILFVDDDLTSRLLNGAVLRECGFEVLEARSYAEACRVIQQHPRLAALVTETDLRGEADGFEVARRARGANAEIPVVYLATSDLKTCITQAVRNSRLIAKPYDPYQVVRALEDVAPLVPVRMS